MFRIPRYYCSQTCRCLKTLSSLQGVRNGGFPWFSNGIWRPYLNSNLSLTCYIKTCVGFSWSFQRSFKVPSFLSHEKESDSNGKGNTDEPRENEFVTPCKTLISQDVNHKYPGITPSPEFLGIEVFPEIFDQLPPKCSGCGAVLQSNYENKPGYIPGNRNPSVSKNNEENTFMPETICFRCFNVKHYNKDLPPVVSPETISNFLMHISRRKALILYSIDIMDIPGSFIPDILKIVGETKHLILVCNKMDRLAVDGHPRHQVERMKKIILNEAMNFGLENANVKGVCLVSAKTGFGVKELVKSINKYWRMSSDMYIVGSNNSGKTTLFNLLADLFAASRHADDMLQRGTTSLSPGSTLSLLRFPVTHHRFLRLQDRIQHGYSEEKSKENRKEVDLGEDIVDKQTTKYKDLKETTSETSVSSASLSLYRPQFVTRQNEDDLCWLYDTPGLYNENQITHLLTNQELKLLNPSLWFVPRTLILKPGKVLFLGGLARVDYLDVERLSLSDHGKKEDVPKASQSVFFTVFASPNLPLHVTSLERAEMVYKEQANGDLFKVPCGGEERMAGFPALTGRALQVTGVDWKRSAADIILSNVGWIAVTAGSGSIVTVKAYTPNGVGIYLRDPLLPTSVRQRGRRGVPYLGHVNYSIYQGTRRKSPSLVGLLADENEGTQQWMKVAEKKRKQQRLLLKFEKTKWHSKKRIGFSAKSNPIRYLADYEDFTELQDEKTNKNEGKIEASSHQRFE